MTAVSILAELKQRGARVERHGNRLRISPARVVTPELLNAVRRHKPELLPLVPEASHNAATGSPEAGSWRSDLATWSLARHCRWSARAACLETFHGLSATEADQRAYQEVSQEPEPGTEVLVRAGPPGHFALAFTEAPPGDVSLAEALAALSVANERWDHGDDAGCQRAMERLEEALAVLKRQEVTAWLVS